MSRCAAIFGSGAACDSVIDSVIASGIDSAPRISVAASPPVSAISPASQTQSVRPYVSPLSPASSAW